VGSRQGTTALAVVVVAILSAVYTLAAGNQPLLGLDLQGGVSVVLQPTQPPDEEALAQTVEIIRSRVDSLGVAEPEISTQGDTIVVDLPGVEEQQRALELVGQTAELRFRPVISDLVSPSAIDPELETGDDEPSTDTTDTTDDTADSSVPEDSEPASSSTTDSTTADGDEESLGLPAGRSGAALVQQGDSESTTTTADDESTTTTTADDESTSTTAADDESATTIAADDETTTTTIGEQGTVDPAILAISEACSIDGVTAPEDDLADRPVVLIDEAGNRICLGPTLVTGDALETAGVSLDPLGAWTVNPVFKSGASGIDLFNEAAALCWVENRDPIVCPAGRLAIVLDHVVVSSPNINAAAFSRDGIVISGDFDEEGARDLAAVLRFGALPVELQTQQTRTVSASIGDDVLRAGVIAGLIGLTLVAIYLLAYYRLAGLVAIGGLVISATLLWAIIAWFGENLGLALTLAGVVGLIVAVGVSADSNIVYFENVKDAYRGGRKVSTSVERAYRSAISTIVKADVVSLIAAALLYWLTVGAVRGFAFYLGLATILDLIISWLFMRPALAFLARRKVVMESPTWLGLPGGDQS
jgi:preprotein translocase subunit SecD